MSDLPVSKEKLMQMLNSDSEAGFKPEDVRVIPSGFSSGLSGGAYVEVGGDPNNCLTWKYTLIFGADGKLAYYLKGR
jgi:hypothetical protein